MSYEVRYLDTAGAVKVKFPPGPRLPFAHLARFFRDPYHSLEYAYRRYGPVLSLPGGSFGERTVLVGDPELIKQVFVAGPRRFHTGEGNALMLEPVVGENSILSLDEDRHRRSRKIMVPPLQASRIQGYEPVMTEIVDREIDRMPVGEPFPLVRSLRGVALEVLMRLMLGMRDEQRLARFRAAVEPVATPPNVITWIPQLRRDLGRWSPWTRFVRTRDRLYRLLEEEIALRRAEPDLEERDDILSLLVQAHDDEGRPLTDIEVRDEMMGVMGAGHHTTTAAVAWMFDQLLRDGELEQQLRADIDAGEDRWLHATIQETLRWRAPIYGVPRKTMQDIEIGDWRLPAGAYLALILHLVHRRPDLYDDPEAFRPARFLDKEPDPLLWIPFGGGERKCIGARFALTEMKVIARTILSRVRLSKVDQRRERPKMSYVIIFPGRGVEVTVSERLPARQPELAAAR
ncbi:MAG: cytochrome P450 [Thermoleophilaceae bacterium]